MPKRRKEKIGKQTSTKVVPLDRRTILKGHCSMLVPGPITNSGKADGGWMDRVGISAAGLGHIFSPPNAWGPVGYPIDCFYSNYAYSRPGFCTMQLELHPPLEDISINDNDESTGSTPESLLDYLKGYCRETENDEYQQGKFETIDTVPAVIEKPSTIGSPASLIVQTAFEVLITPQPGRLPPGLTATTYVALVHFANRGNVLFKANNFERHRPPLDYQTLLASITYMETAAPYHGPDRTLSGFAAWMESGGDWRKAGAKLARQQAAGGDELPKYCLHCGAHETPSGDPLHVCSKCERGTYCSRECQKSDWKRHKKSECQK